MARVRTLAQLRAEVRDGAGIQGLGALARFPDSTVNRYINQALAALYDLILDHSSGDEYTNEQAASTGAGNETVACPDDFYRLKGVLAQAGQNWIPLRRFKLDQVAEVGAGTAYTMRYRLVFGPAGQSPQLYFSPVPGSAIPLRIFYVPFAPELSADADDWDGFNGWEEYAVKYAVLNVGGSEQNPAMGTVEQLMERARDRIASMAAAQDMGEPDRIGVVEFSRGQEDSDYPDYVERLWS